MIVDLQLLIAGQQPWTYTGSTAREFGYPSVDTLSRQQREHLVKQQKEFTEWVERPSKFEKKATQPACFDREIKYMKFTHHPREFGDNSHSSWETFMGTVKSKEY